MAKVQVDIPDSKLDEYSKKKIESLERKLKNAEAREAKAKRELADRKAEFEQARQLKERIESLAIELRSEFMLYDDYC